MFEFAISVGLGGLFCFALGVAYFLYICFMYVVYRLTNGKMKFREYIKYW